MSKEKKLWPVLCACVYIKCAICHDVWGGGMCAVVCDEHVTQVVCMDQSYFNGPSAIKYRSHTVTTVYHQAA